MHRSKPISRIRKIHWAKCCDIAGDDAGSIEHYSAALKITPNFYSSNVGIGDTRTLMGDYAGARAQYDKVIAAATNPRDKLHAQFQKSLTYFWEGQPEEGRKALHATLESARHQKEPYEQFEVRPGARAALREQRQRTGTIEVASKHRSRSPSQE